MRDGDLYIGQKDGQSFAEANANGCDVRHSRDPGPYCREVSGERVCETTSKRNRVRRSYCRGKQACEMAAARVIQRINSVQQIRKANEICLTAGDGTRSVECLAHEKLQGGCQCHGRGFGYMLIAKAQAHFGTDATGSDM
eukprot:c3056_g1_i2.p2 GENE.c3056_g1_i2~~c3056_g1_i2.p2  ORF type:complete len:140 (-),score=11.08 c3056_g1_i2:1103-1522(-)